MRVLGSTRSIPTRQYVATTQVSTTNMFAVYKWQQDAVGWGTRYPIATFSGQTGYDVRFSPDNAYIVTTTDTTVKMFPFTFGGIGTVISGGPQKSLSNPNAGLSWHPDQDVQMTQEFLLTHGLLHQVSAQKKQTLQYFPHW